MIAKIHYFSKTRYKTLKKNSLISPHHHLPFLLSLQMLTKQKHPYFKHPKHNQINKIYETRKSQTSPETSQKIFDLIANNPHITRRELADIIGINQSAIQKHIDILIKNGYIKKEGRTRNRYFIILNTP